MTGPAAWTGRELRERTDWVVELDSSLIDALEYALTVSRRLAPDLADIGANTFPLPQQTETVQAWREILLNGRGFLLLRGLPVERYSKADIARLYLGLGSHLGTPLPQNARGHLLGHIIDVGRNTGDPAARTYQTSERQYFHADSCDVVGLLCLRKARRGGESAIVSTVTLFNAVRERRPDLLPTLFAPFSVDRRGEIPDGQKPWYEIPLFNWYNDAFSSYYVRRYIESAQRFDQLSRLSPQQTEALDLIDALCEEPDLRLDMQFEPGDIQLLNNLQIFHDRTAFEDWPEPDRRRYLLRLWLCPPGGRPLPPCFAARWGSVTPGARGGIRMPGTKLTVELDPD